MDASNDYKKIAGSSERTKHQVRQLSVTLDNRDKEVIKNVHVKWTLFGHKMPDNTLVTLKQGSVKTAVDALKTSTVKCEKVVISGTPKYTVTTKKAVRGTVQVDTKHHPASGEDYYGYAVRVYAGSILIDEFYSHPSLKQEK